MTSHLDKSALPDPVSYFEGQGLVLKGRGTWRTTSCTFHGGSDSMRINVQSGAWICMSCGIKGGDLIAYYMAAHLVDFPDACRALGAWRDGAPTRTKPMPFSARAALEVLERESLIAAVAAENVAKGIALSDTDCARLVVAAGRIRRVREGVTHG